MKKKGFTLIELLAVIVILAIIALIATPIILNIINDTRSEARIRSAEAVSHAVETAYLTSMMKVEANGSQASFTNNDVIRKTKIENERSRVVDDDEKDPSITTNDGVTCTLSETFVLTCTYSDENVIEPKTISDSSIGNGTAQTSVPRYYYWGSGNINGGLPTTNIDKYVKNITIPNNHPFYLAFDSADGDKIDAAYVCFVKTIDETPTEFCIQGGVAEELRAEVFTSNQGILDTAFQSACSLGGVDYYCSADGLRAYANSNSYVDASGGSVLASAGSAHCSVSGGGAFECYEY